VRNRSLTKEEVEAFRRQQKKPAKVNNAGEIVVVAAPPHAPFPCVHHQPESPRSLRPSTLSHVRSSPPEMTRTGGDGDGDGDAAASPSTSRDWYVPSCSYS
jgi:hypothetical protein